MAFLDSFTAAAIFVASCETELRAEWLAAVVVDSLIGSLVDLRVKLLVDSLVFGFCAAFVESLPLVFCSFVICTTIVTMTDQRTQQAQNM